MLHKAQVVVVLVLSVLIHLRRELLATEETVYQTA
jgi:hypothetical protein